MACILHTVRFRHRFQRLAAAEMRKTIEDDQMGSVFSGDKELHGMEDDGGESADRM